MVEGELHRIRTGLTPGVFEMDDGSAIRTTSDTALGIPADPEEAPEEPDVSEAAWEREHRTRSGEWTFTNLEHASDWARNKFSPWIARLQPEHRHSLAVYKGDDAARYRQINRALRGRDDWTRDALRHAPLVDEALGLHRLSEPLVVHRGIPIDDLERWPPNVGQHIREPAFMSTSLVPSVPETTYSSRRGEPVQMHIGLPSEPQQASSTLLVTQPQTEKFFSRQGSQCA